MRTFWDKRGITKETEYCLWVESIASFHILYDTEKIKIYLNSCCTLIKSLQVVLNFMTY